MTAKKLGIWMDHHHAFLTEFTAAPMQTKLIENEFTEQVRGTSLGKGESHMHAKEQRQYLEYYKKLAEVIKHYEEVILYGPTDAKVELFNTLSHDHVFANIRIEVKQADKMTENQQHAYVLRHFSRH